MAALGITVLKNNVPWGPFTREQIEDGLARGDFTVKYLAHAQGLKDWLPLSEVIDYVERYDGPSMPSLPPVPGTRELPPIPEPPSRRSPRRPPILPPVIHSVSEKPAPPWSAVSPVSEKPEPSPRPSRKST